MPEPERRVPVNSTIDAVQCSTCCSILKADGRLRGIVTSRQSYWTAVVGEILNQNVVVQA